MAKKKRASKTGSLVELVMIVAIALVLALLIQAFLVKPYRIPSPSMLPTLTLGQRILVDRIGERFGDPKVGDIVVFKPPLGADPPDDAPMIDKCGSGTPIDGSVCERPSAEQADVNYVKRIVAGPGDRITIQGGRVTLNGEPQDEPYIRPCEGGSGCDFPNEYTVPAGHYFMMGDNRGQSDDSRFWGPVPRDWIIGGAFATYWPPSRIGKL